MEYNVQLKVHFGEMGFGVKGKGRLSLAVLLILLSIYLSFLECMFEHIRSCQFLSRRRRRQVEQSGGVHLPAAAPVCFCRGMERVGEEDKDEANSVVEAISPAGCQLYKCLVDLR